jgi:hypothetical protein
MLLNGSRCLPPGKTKATVAAWKQKPSYAVIPMQDRMINPDLERFITKRAQSRVIELPGSHAIFLSHAPEAAALIEKRLRQLARDHRADAVAAGKHPHGGTRMRHQSRSSSRSCGDNMAKRSLPRLPCSTRSIMRLESTSLTFRATTSMACRPAP